MRNKIIILILFMFSGCNKLMPIVMGSHNLSADNNSNLRTIIQRETGIVSIKTTGDVARLAIWQRTQLEKDNCGRLSLKDDISPQQLPGYFKTMMDQDQNTRGTAWCQQNALSLGSLMDIYGIKNGQVQTVQNGIGIHSFVSYLLGDHPHVIDSDFGVDYGDASMADLLMNRHDSSWMNQHVNSFMNPSTFALPYDITYIAGIWSSNMTFDYVY